MSDTPTCISEEQRQLLEQQCREIGADLKSKINPKVGFALLLFDFGDGGSLAYISNAQRADVINALCELLDKLSAR